MWKCLLRREGLLPCQHAVAVHMLNPVVLPLHSTCDEEEGLKAQQVTLTGVEESQGLSFLRCDIIVISRDADASTCVHIMLFLGIALLHYITGQHTLKIGLVQSYLDLYVAL